MNNTNSFHLLSTLDPNLSSSPTPTTLDPTTTVHRPHPTLGDHRATVNQKSFGFRVLTSL